MAAPAANASNSKSFAEVVKGTVEKPDFFDSAVSEIHLPPSYPNKRIPNTKELHSFFVDLLSTDATQTQVADAMPVDSIVGVNYHRNLKVVEFVCTDAAAQEAVLKTTFTVEGKKPFVAIKPRHLIHPTVMVKMSNVPYGNEGKLRQAINDHWTTYGTILDISPLRFPGKPWLTKRWDVLIQLEAGQKKLDSPVVFKLDGFNDTVVCSRRNSKKACLRCKTARHSTSNCPGSAPKVGETANPRQKIARVERAEKGKEKGADLHSDFSMEIEIPGSAEISSATNKTAAGILTLPDAPQNQPKTSAALTQSTSAQSRPTTPPNTKHPSPASAGNSPARKQRNTQTGTRMRTRAATSHTLSSLPESVPKKIRSGNSSKWYDVCPLCEDPSHNKKDCILLLPKYVYQKIERFKEINLTDDRINPTDNMDEI